MLEVQPVDFDEACEFIERYHRHHRKPQGFKYCIGINDGSKLVGVAIVGRPVARNRDDGWTLEVTRLCTDGTKNACSSLYSACWRAARAMGYRKLGTYILKDEPGVSLRAAGWRMIGETRAESWNRKERARFDKHPICQKQLWEIEA